MRQAGKSVIPVKLGNDALMRFILLDYTVAEVECYCLSDLHRVLDSVTSVLFLAAHRLRHKLRIRYPSAMSYRTIECSRLAIVAVITPMWENLL